MGAILGLAIGAVLLLLIAILWMSGAFQPRGTKGPGEGAVNAQAVVPKKRVPGID
jgi:hypothetical protein